MTIELLFAGAIFAGLMALAVVEVWALLDLGRYVRAASRWLRSAVCVVTGGHRFVKVGTKHIRTFHSPEDGDCFDVSRCERRICGRRHYELVYEGSC